MAVQDQLPPRSLGVADWWVRVISIALVVTAGGVVVYGTLVMTGQVDPVVSARMVDPFGLAARPLEVDGVVDVEVIGRVPLEDGDHDARALYLSIVVIGVALGGAAVRELAQVFRSIAIGNPFEPRNAVRLRRVGLALFAAPYVFMVENNLLAEAIDHPAGIEPSFGQDEWVLVPVALVLLVLAKVFRAGTRQQMG